MLVYFSGACHDERGNYTNGVPGDQTGAEVRTTTAYTHKQGWRIFRHPNKNIAKWIGTNARVMANNNYFGYCQGHRDSAYVESKRAGWEPANVKTACECDCSSMVRTCVACALEREIPNFNTVTEPNVLLNLGFQEITGTPLDSLKLGDIVVTPRQGHTEIVSSGSSTPSVQYYPASDGGGSIVNGLNKIGVDSSFGNRKKIAEKNGITGYTGSAAQNTQMCNLLKAGKLIKA